VICGADSWTDGGIAYTCFVKCAQPGSNVTEGSEVLFDWCRGGGVKLLDWTERPSVHITSARIGSNDVKVRWADIIVAM
jgi:hypothetical protein